MNQTPSEALVAIRDLSLSFAGKPAGTWFYLPKPQRDHFSFLCNHIEKMFLTGKPSYPVERTLIVTGMLAFLMDSHHEGGRRIETPELEKVGYRPAVS